MKKIIKTALLALAVTPMLAACGNSSSGVKVEDVGARALATVGVGYGEYAQSSGITLAGGKLITEYELDGLKFNFTYAVTAVGTYSIEYVKLNGNKIVVEIPTYAELNPNGGESVTYAAYKLNAKVTYAGVAEGGKEANKGKIGAEVAAKDFNIRVNAEKVKPVWEKIANARKKSSGETVVTSGYVCAIMNNKDSAEYQNGVWLADGSDGIMLYGSALTSYFGSLKIGDMLMVIGTASPYNGLFEIKPTTISFVEDAPEAVAKPEFKERTEADLANFTAENCSDLVTLKNVTITSDVSKLTAAASTAISLGVKVGNTSYTYYINKHTSLADRQALVAHLQANAGKTCTLKTVMGWNNNLQITACEIEDGKGLVPSVIF